MQRQLDVLVAAITDCDLERTVNPPERASGPDDAQPVRRIVKKQFPLQLGDFETRQKRAQSDDFVLEIGSVADPGCVMPRVTDFVLLPT